MRKIFIFFLLLCSFATVNCFGKNETSQLGSLVFIQVSQNGVMTIESLNLSNLKIKKIYKTSNLISNLRKIDSENLLFNMYDNGLGLYMINLTTGIIQKLGYDQLAGYLPNKRILLFYKTLKDYVNFNEEHELYCSNINKYIKAYKDHMEDRIALYSAAISSIDTINTLTTVIPVSENKIIFMQFMGASNGIFSFDLNKMKLQLLPIKNCESLWGWRKATKQLIGFDNKKKKYLLTDLSGKKVNYLPLDGNGIPIAYIPEKDKIIWTTTNSKEKTLIDLYDFKTKKLTTIYKGNINPDMGEAVYLPPR